jgi:hypothetical protein
MEVGMRGGCWVTGAMLILAWVLDCWREGEGETYTVAALIFGVVTSATSGVDIGSLLRDILGLGEAVVEVIEVLHVVVLQLVIGEVISVDGLLLPLQVEVVNLVVVQVFFELLPGGNRLHASTFVSLGEKIEGDVGDLKFGVEDFSLEGVSLDGGGIEHGHS